MLSLVTAAEQQYRYDVWTRDRELAVLSSIRARRDATRSAPTSPPAVGTAASPAAWARPIGARMAPAGGHTACAVA